MRVIQIFLLMLVSLFLTFPSFAKVSKGGLNYEYIQNADKPVLILSHSFANNMNLWKDVVPLLEKDFSLLLYDLRGQGKSVVTKTPYTMKILGDDVIALMDELNIKKAYFSGSSISGFLAQWMALNHADRIIKVVVSNSGYTTQDPGTQKWFKERHAELYDGRPKVFVDYLLGLYFDDNFKASHNKRYLEMKKVIQSTSSKGMANGVNAFMDIDFTDKLSQIDIPTLIIQGIDEKGFDPNKIGNFMHDNICNSELRIMHGGHINMVEYPEEYAKAVKEFLLK